MVSRSRITIRLQICQNNAASAPQIYQYSIFPGLVGRSRIVRSNTFGDWLFGEWSSWDIGRPENGRLCRFVVRRMVARRLVGEPK
jgi:hypothetical protein